MMWIGCICCENIQSDFATQIFALIAPIRPVLHQVLCSNVTVPNAHKHYETQQNVSLGSNGVDRVRSLRKILMRLHGRNLRIIVPVRPVLHRVSYSNETVPNTPKHYKKHQNMCLWSNGVDRLCSLRITPTRRHCKTFCINCVSLARFALSFVQ